MATTTKTTKTPAKKTTKRVAFTRGSTNSDGLTRKDLCYREFLRLIPDDRKAANVVAFSDKNQFGLSHATIGKWVSSWNSGGKPSRSVDVADPHKKPAKRTTKKAAKK